MIGMVATVRVKEDKAELFEDLFRELTALVRADEPGCLTYQLTKSRTEADTYKILELYQDQAAVDEHSKSERAKALFGEIAGCLVGRPQIEYLDGVI